MMRCQVNEVNFEATYDESQNSQKLFVICLTKFVFNNIFYLPVYLWQIINILLNI